MERANNEIVLDLQKIAALIFLLNTTPVCIRKKAIRHLLSIRRTIRLDGNYSGNGPSAANPNQVRHDIAGILAEILTDAAKDAAKE